MIPATPACTVLLVEDMEADAHLTRTAFRESHFLVDLHHAVDGVDGMEFLRRQGKWAEAPRPDLILLDLNMPRMDGREFLATLKNTDDFAAIPVVVLTTSEVERDVLASYRTGAAGYIVKPLDMNQFIEAIRNLETYWMTLVRLPGKR